MTCAGVGLLKRTIGYRDLKAHDARFTTLLMLGVLYRFELIVIQRDSFVSFGYRKGVNII